MKQKFLFRIPLLTAIALFLAIPLNIFAGGKPDFTGSWTLNENKSELGEGRFFAALTITVIMEKNSITIEQTSQGRNGEMRTRSETLTLDGKENVSQGENRKTVSTVSWSEDGKSMVIKSTTEWTRNGETMEMKRTEKWSLGESDKILKIHSSSSSPRGEFSRTLVYDKK